MNDNLISALSKALAMEEKGYKFYQDTSAKSKNSITKKTFDFLADNEILHIENIKKFYAALEKKGAFPEVDWKSIKRKAQQRCDTVFPKHRRTERKSGAGQRRYPGPGICHGIGK